MHQNTQFRNAEGVSDPSERESPVSVLGTLADSESRAILEATATEPKSIAELVDECRLSTATAYRKVDALVDIGLLDERVRIRSDGRNAAEYAMKPGEITITLDDSEGLRIEY
ncbi:helix-turn-helix transcriptional regulator [Natronomonas sp. LN261]|uniref:helix-turn-helix transcriptional regulator n=1 Tax=Natronomonas sp. LN261 TaxID=2750669 RepID=UPI0015EE50EA|nr:helix-turn-helix transcriptional regulator [Natronomonas sp. LN261]